MLLPIKKAKNRSGIGVGRKNNQMQIRKTVYILLVMFLGLLLAEIIHWLIEIWLVNAMLDHGVVPVQYISFGAHCFLPPCLQFGLLFFGLFGGYRLGQAWWRIVYVEHRHWRGRKFGKNNVAK